MTRPAWTAFDESEVLERAPSLADCWDELQPKLPADRRWFAGSWPEAGLGALVHTPCDTFAVLSDATGKVAVTARRLGDGRSFTDEAAESAARIRRLAERWDPAEAGTLVLGANDREAGPWMLLDGNHRASARELRRLERGEPAEGRLPVVLAWSATPLRPW